MHPLWPVVVAANRDEVLTRKGTPPAILNDFPRVVAGRDPLRGGTWLGATQNGFFAGLTNQREAVITQRPRSRGEVVLAALGRSTVDGVEDLLRSLDPDAYAPFNLLWGEASALRVGYCRPGRDVEINPLGPGLTVLANDVLGTDDFPRTLRVSERLPPEVLRELTPAETVSSLTSLLGDHEGPPSAWRPRNSLGIEPSLARQLQRVCVHTEHYGTVSSTVLLLTAGRVDRYLFADGAPCVTAFTDFTSLFE